MRAFIYIQFPQFACRIWYSWLMVINTKTIIAQALGFVALAILIIVFQKNNRKTMLQLMMVAAFLFSVHFFMLGAMTGAAMNLLNVFRSYVFANREDKKWAKHGWWLYVFLFLVAILGIFTWDGYYSALALFAVAVQTFAFWSKNTNVIRLISLIVPPCWFAYNFIVGSIPGMVTEVLILASILVGIYRFDIKKRPAKSRSGA